MQSFDLELSSLSLDEVDSLLDELASRSAYSDTSLRNRHRTTARPKLAVLRELYRSIPSLDASFLTQIILKDLRPILYPPPSTHYTTALKEFNSKARTMLTKEDAMKAWDPSRNLIRIYKVRSSFHEAAMEFENNTICSEASPQVGVPIEVSSSPWLCRIILI